LFRTVAAVAAFGASILLLDAIACGFGLLSRTIPYSNIPLSAFLSLSLFLAVQYPEESVAMQQRIINRVEGDPHYRSYLNANILEHDNTPTDAVIVAAKQISKTIGAKAMVCFSLTGSTARRASKNRPGVPIMAMSPFKEVSRQLAMSWGVYPDLPKAGTYGYTVSEEDMFDYDKPIIEKTEDDLDMVLRNACRAALKKGLISDPDDLLVVTAGLPFGTPGAANVIRIVPAAGPSCWDGVCRAE
jgi:pyruvate kinase